MALSAEQLAFRKFLLGGSAANVIGSGDQERIYALWQEYTGQAEPEDLSGVLQVQMGAFTEPFNVAWFQKQTGRVVAHQGEERISLDMPFMGATLDGLTDDGETVFEAKHVSAFAKSEEILARYMPQLTHYMIVCEVERAVLSVLYGNHKWESYDIKLDQMYAVQLVESEQKFWQCVQERTPPFDLSTPAPVEAIRRADMTGNNEWASHADIWLANKGYAKTFEKAAKELKGLVEPDVVEATGHGISITRSKAGALTIKPLKD